MNVTRVIAAFALWALFGGCADEDADAPRVAIDPAPICVDPSQACLGADARNEQVAGVRVLYKQVIGQPTVALRLLFDCDSQRFPRGGHQAWAEALTLWLISEVGPRDFGSAEWRRAWNELGANVESVPGVDYATLDVEVPRPHFRESLALLRASLRDLERSDYYIENFTSFTRVQNELEQEEPDTAGARKAIEIAWRGTPFAQRYEQLAALRRLGSKHVVQAQRALLNKPRLTVVVVGDVDWESVRGTVESDFGLLPEAYVAAGFEPDSVVAAPTESISVLSFPSSTTWHIYFNSRGPAATDSMFPAVRLAMQILETRLYGRIRSELGLAYTVGAAAHFYRQLFVELWLTTRRPTEGLVAMREVLAQTVTTPPSEAELVSARGLERTALFASADTPGGLADTLGDWALTTGAHDDVDRYMQQLAGVTAEQVALAWSMYLRGGAVVAAGGGSEPPSTALLESIVPR